MPRLYCSIYKHTGIGCTNGGTSDTANDCTVIWGETREQILALLPSLDKPVYVLMQAIPGGKAERLINLAEFLGTDTTPIKIFDRYEG